MLLDVGVQCVFLMCAEVASLKPTSITKRSSVAVAVCCFKCVCSMLSYSVYTCPDGADINSKYFNSINAAQQIAINSKA